MTHTEVTLTIDGSERDVPVRGSVLVEPGLGMGGSIGAEIDGGVQLRIDRRWVDVEDVALDAQDVERIDEALCEAALEAP